MAIQQVLKPIALGGTEAVAGRDSRLSTMKAAALWPARALGLTSRAALTARVERTWGWVPFAVLFGFFTAIAFEPIPAEQQNAPWTTTDTLLSIFLYGPILASFIGGSIAAALGSRLGLVVALPATAFLLFSVVTCPLSGHHSWGTWAIGSYGSAFVATGLLAYSLAKTRNAPSRDDATTGML